MIRPPKRIFNIDEQEAQNPWQLEVLACYTHASSAGDSVWFVTEYDDRTDTGFGWVQLAGMEEFAELGSIGLQELDDLDCKLAYSNKQVRQTLRTAVDEWLAEHK